MSIGSFIRNTFTVVRYRNGSWEYNKSSANYLTKQNMEYFLNVYAVNACININADYLSKFKWGVKKSEGIDYKDPRLDIIKNPNIYQNTEGLIRQFQIFKSVYGWTYQKTFGGDREKNPDAIYNLNPANIDFKSNTNNPFLIWKSSDIKNNKDKSFTYDDNGVKKTYKFSEIMPFFDMANGICEDENSYYTSPSKIQSIIKNITNLDFSLDAENVILGTAGREALFSDSGSKPTANDFGINAKPISEKSRKDIDSKLNNINKLRRREMRSFSPAEPLTHVDMSLRPKDFGYDSVMSHQESIITRHFNVPNEIYQAYKQGSTWENQTVADVKMIDGKQSEANDIARSWTNSFGDVNEPFIATADHVRSIQKEENKKADTAFKITQSLFNITRTGMTEEQAIDFLVGLGVNLND